MAELQLRVVEVRCEIIYNMEHIMCAQSSTHRDQGSLNQSVSGWTHREEEHTVDRSRCVKSVQIMPHQYITLFIAEIVTV